jgi:hypothetical protein
MRWRMNERPAMSRQHPDETTSQSGNTLEQPYRSDSVIAKCLIDNPVSLRYL